ncbi:MAG: UDP-glucose--hexose-1-phosphate uridylyltransferase [Lachnospiraceae bacterium]|nr:UDP-glucose--hexose-1-phosphate uridylyltransferase [Lachnospiraceae bacterium]MDY5742314.1 UDP-glucose--hexose-1-phosphate uridylyltransferase [Lachnospiraceae bacterium]
MKENESVNRISEQIGQLIAYGIRTGLLPEAERYYATNLLLDIMDESAFLRVENERSDATVLEDILAGLLDSAVAKGLIEDRITSRDLFDTRLMNALLPRPAEVQARFFATYETDPVQATDDFYRFSMDSDYIRRYRIAKDRKWKFASEYGDIDITINLSKPEKDPKAIAAAGKAVAGGYPKCMLCMENEGYAGHEAHPARQNLRIIPLQIDGCKWGFQYSPYVYYPEHCIVFNGEHTPMRIEKATFRKLFDFVSFLPHYFLGSNADLPIVGGSILSHDHFQGGHYRFAMEAAPIETPIRLRAYPHLTAGIVKWPMSVIRLQGDDKDGLIQAADDILQAWIGYSDPTVDILAYSGEQRHNTITPIARMRNGRYELDLVLRNNRTTEDHPLGLFHPHAELHHIKKENIGLIEVMGLAVLPARLKTELDQLENAWQTGQDISKHPELEKHADWYRQLQERYPQINKEDITAVLEHEVGRIFVRVLEDAGVFKRNKEGKAAFLRFTESIG